MRVLNITQSTTIAENARLADTFSSRMVGLLNRKELNAGEALVITRCQSIHMFFMRFAIDVVFADKSNRVVGLLKEIKPNRLSPIFFKASYCVECPVGVIDQTKTSVGDQLELS